MERTVCGCATRPFLVVARHQLYGVVDGESDEHRYSREHRRRDRSASPQRDSHGEHGCRHRGDQRPQPPAHSEERDQDQRHDHQRDGEQDCEQLCHRAHNARAQQRCAGNGVREPRIVKRIGARGVCLSAALRRLQRTKASERLQRRRAQLLRVRVAPEAMGQLRVDLVFERGDLGLVAHVLRLEAHRDDRDRVATRLRPWQHRRPLRLRVAKLPLVHQRAVGKIEQRALEEHLAARRYLEHRRDLVVAIAEGRGDAVEERLGLGLIDGLSRAREILRPQWWQRILCHRCIHGLLPRVEHLVTALLRVCAARVVRVAGRPDHVELQQGLRTGDVALQTLRQLLLVRGALLQLGEVIRLGDEVGILAEHVAHLGHGCLSQ